MVAEEPRAHRLEGELLSARIRDVVAVAVLITAGSLAVLAWHPLGRWVALGVALLGLLVAAGVYRARLSAPPPLGKGGVDEPEAALPPEPRATKEPTAPTTTPSRRHRS